MKLKFLFIIITIQLFSCIDSGKKYIEDEASGQKQVDSTMVFEKGLNINHFLIAQDKETATSYQLKGEVSKIVQTNFWYKSDKKILKKLATDKYEFDKLKKLTLHNSYADDGELFYTYSYQYDNEGFLINYSESNAARFVVSTIPIYSADNLVFKETHFNKDDISIGESVFSFDANEKIIEKITTWTGGLTKNKIISKIDSLGNEVFNINYETVIDKEFGAFAETANEYTYTKNLVDEEKQFLPWGISENYKERLNLTIKNKYDANQLLTEQIYYKKDGDVDYVLTYSYSFDTNNNWIAQTIFRDGKKHSQLEREISYYSDPI